MQAARGFLAKEEIGHREISDARIRGGAPLEAAERAALADAALPHDGALVVGIERPHHAGLLPDHDEALAVWQIAEDRGVAEVEVRTVVTHGTVLALRAAANHVNVPGRDLAGPDDLAAIERHRDHRVARRAAGPRVFIAGGD